MARTDGSLRFIEGGGKGKGRKKDGVSYPVLQRTVARVLKKRFSANRLDELLDELSPRDQAMFFTALSQYLFVKPIQPRDPLDRLAPEQVDELYERLLKAAK
jgi:hypothetical protein